VSVITVYTDGGCSGNPGPGGWAAVVFFPAGKRTLSGHERTTTNNRMELTAVLAALREIKRHGAGNDRVAVHTDSQYVKKGITEWIHTWQKNGWKNSAKQPVKNQDLWKDLKTLADSLPVDWHWVKGHADNEHNNECDRLVGLEIKKVRT